MPAYIVFIRDQMLNAEAYAQYLQVAAPTLAKYNGEIIVFNGANEALEGAEIDGSVVLRFPDMASARAWYNSPEYSQVKAMRINATLGRAVLLEGLATNS